MDDHDWKPDPIYLLVQGHLRTRYQCTRCNSERTEPFVAPPGKTPGWTMRPLKEWDGKTSCDEVMEEQRKTWEASQKDYEERQAAARAAALAKATLQAEAEQLAREASHASKTTPAPLWFLLALAAILVLGLTTAYVLTHR